MHIILVGISHRTAPVEIREHFAFNRHEVAEAGHLARDGGLVSECVILCTCNRTEVYAAVSDPVAEPVVEFLCRFRNLDPKNFTTHFYFKFDSDTVDHLFRVASGLDSMVVGEAQILAQVKEAYLGSLEAGNSGRILNTLFKAAITAGKRGRTETEIGRGAVSVSHAAVELAQKIYGDLHGRTSLILGAGEMSEITARLLVNAGVKSVIVSNRTYERAEELASQIGGDAIHYDRFPEALRTADIVISSTGAPHAIIEKEMVREVMHHRRGKPIFLIDIAVPRDIEQSVGDIDNVFLYDIDDLQVVVDRNMAERQKEVEKVLAIIEEEKDKFLQWFASLDALPTIADLQKRLEEIRQAEIERFGPSLSRLTDSERQVVEMVTQGLVKRILKDPMTQLKHAARNGHGYASVEAIRYLFNLDEQVEGASEKTD